MTGDITRNYHGGNKFSVAANPNAQAKNRDSARIYKLLHSKGRSGATCQECEDELGMLHETCSARLTELKKDNFVVVIGKRQNRSHNDAGVNILAQFATLKEVAAYKASRNKKAKMLGQIKRFAYLLSLDELEQLIVDLTKTLEARQSPSSSSIFS